ncbi:MAG: hypothetical protein FJW80_09145 [Actinobacteria bacterium]|nr:hypothetical protein [Actinomycetota bacterium]
MDATTTADIDSDWPEEARLDESQRSGSPRSLAATWAGVLLAPGTIITGMVAAGGSADPGLAIGFAGLAVGTILGSLAVGSISICGPRTGMAQMPLGRLAFGALNVVPQIFLIGSLIAYNALNDLFGVDTLATRLGIPFLVALAAVVAIEVPVVIVGVRLMRVLGTVISAVMLHICIGLIIGASQVPPAPVPPGVEGFPVGPFLLAVGLGQISRNTQLGLLTSDIVPFAGYYTTPGFGVAIVELLYRWKDPKPWKRPVGRWRGAAAAFLIGFILLLPFTATPLGNQIAADYPIALGWLGWVPRPLLNGGDGAHLAGAVFGAVLYALFRHIGRTPNTVTVSSSG